MAIGVRHSMYGEPFGRKATVGAAIGRPPVTASATMEWRRVRGRQEPSRRMCGRGMRAHFRGSETKKGRGDYESIADGVPGAAGIGAGQAARLYGKGM